MIDQYVCIGFLATLVTPLILALVIAKLRKPAINPKRVGLLNAAAFALIPLIGGPPVLIAVEVAYNAAMNAAIMAAPGPINPSAFIWTFLYVLLVIVSPIIGGLSAWAYVGTHNHRRAEILRAGRCFACGYDLTGNVSGRCPECGEEIHHENLHYPWK